MTDLPAWIQEIRDRADKATPGPWFIGLGSGNHLCTGVFSDTEVPLWITDCLSDSMLQSMRTGSATLPRDHAPNMEFIAHARADVPRLIGLVGEMAWNLRNVTDQVQDACRSRMTPLSQCPEPSDDYCPTCPTGLRGECGAPRSLEALRKFRGEVSSND